LIHGFKEDDCDCRLQFSELMLNQLQEELNLCQKSNWIDEANFKLAGYIVERNCVSWDRKLVYYVGESA
jgi:hypothetical protein